MLQTNRPVCVWEVADIIFIKVINDLFLFPIEISVAQFIIREKRISSSARLPTEIPEYNQQFIDDMKSLVESYKQDGKEQLFSTDMELLAEAYRGDGYTDLFIQSVEALIRSLTTR